MCLCFHSLWRLPEAWLSSFAQHRTSWGPEGSHLVLAVTSTPSPVRHRTHLFEQDGWWQSRVICVFGLVVLASSHSVRTQVARSGCVWPLTRYGTQACPVCALLQSLQKTPEQSPPTLTHTYVCVPSFHRWLPLREAPPILHTQRPKQRLLHPEWHQPRWLHVPVHRLQRSRPGLTQLLLR